MNNYLIRLAKAEDIERIQQLSQELVEYCSICIYSCSALTKPKRVI